MRNFFLFLFLAINSSSISARTINISKDIDIEKISKNVYIYTSWADIGKWGRVGSNGLIIVDGNKAFLVDTPMHEDQTQELCRWIDQVLRVSLVGFVPGHWHSDCVGGLDWLNKQGVKTYSNKRTDEILKSLDKPRAQEVFNDSLSVKVGDTPLEFYYPGPGHATDNVVVWIPTQKILFGGCMLKDCSSENLGNTDDAGTPQQWLESVNNIERRFSDVKLYVPGHGKPAGMEIIKHTRKLLKEQIDR